MSSKPHMIASRRAFLAGATSLFGAGWVGTAMAEEPDSRTKALFAAWHRARRADRKLLVVIVPAEADRYTRGQVLGATLNHGSDRVLAALDTVELTVATPEELANLGPVAEPGAWFVLVDTQVPVSFESWQGPTSPGKEPPFGWDHDEEQNAYWDTWIANTELLLTGKLPTDTQDAASLAAAAERSRKKLVEKPMSGAYWAHSGGCGLRIEDVQTMMAVGCGMGHTPEKARRMLYLYQPGESMWL